MIKDNIEALDSTDFPFPANRFGFVSRLTLSCFFLAIVIALPSGIVAWFDGLPWTGEVETLTLSVIIPFLLVLGWRFLSSQTSILFLCILLFLKVILFFGSPSSGWLVKIYPNLSQENLSKFHEIYTDEKKGWIKTYASWWNENTSAIHLSSWDEKLDFPLDWVLPRGIGTNKNLLPVESLFKAFEDLNVVVEIDGVLLIPKEKKFALLATGVKEGTLTATNEHGDSFTLTPAKNFKDAVQQQYHLPEGEKWEISGKLNYTGPDWSFVPVLIGNNGQITTDLGRDVLWQNNADFLSSSNRIGIYKFLSMIVDGGIVIFLLVWMTAIGKDLNQRRVLNFPLVIFSVLGIFVPYIVAPFFASLLKVVHLSDPTKFSYLGVSILIVGLSFLFWILWQKDYRSFQVDKIVPSIFLFFGPAILFYFSNTFWFGLGQSADYGTTDDWMAYQLFARKIVVGGEWLRAGEDVFYMQPLYRYFVGIYHLLFGQSSFAQRMADVWCVLGATILIAKWTVKLRISTGIIFVASIVYLAINLIGASRYHIGRSLIEYHAMIFMFLAGWLLYGSTRGNYVKIVLAGICGVIGYWIRQDHLIVITALVFFLIEPTHGTAGEVWRLYWEQIRSHWKRGFTYVGVIALGVFLICFRNWWVGGVFGPTEIGHPNYTAERGLIFFYQRVRLIIAGSYSETPTIDTLILLPGTFFGLLALMWRPKFLQNYPMAIGISLIGLFLPYWFVANWGYPPRYSIHLLPLALLSVAIILNKIMDDTGFPTKLSRE